MKTQELFLLYRNLFIFYGPFWIISTGILFFIIQFFSEKKYAIGIIKPPTITYFLSYTILIITIIIYLNYEYYYDFLSGDVKAKFIKIFFINFILIITGIIFIILKKINKKWWQIFFLIILFYNLNLSSTSVVYSDIKFFENEKREILPQGITPRKIRIVFTDSLSLSFLLSLTSEQKLLNFNYLINNGIRGRIACFKPNLNLSLFNSTLSGLKPNEFKFHTNFKFKFMDMNHEFDIFPRYIFFRYSSNVNSTAFYKKYDHKILDSINENYQSNNFKTIPLVNPFHFPIYSEKSLQGNNLFIQLFSDIIEKKGRKYQIVKKSFFFDDYLKNRIPNLKDSHLHYSIVRLRGLGAINKYFYQYYRPEIFGKLLTEDIKNFGWIVEKYYEYYDSIIGNLISTTGDNELLVILSFFEYEPLQVWRRILVNLLGKKDIYVYKSLNSTGTILLYEKKALKKDYPLKTISIYDLFPTLLYYSGFQLSRDLQGEVIKEIFTDEFLLNNPIDITINPGILK